MEPRPDDPLFTPEMEELCRHLHAWIAGELIDLYRRDPNDRPGGLLLSALVWGDKYVNRFLDLTAKSIEGASNRTALRENGARILLFTDLAGFDKLRGWVEESTAAGVHASMIIMPPPLMAVLARRGDGGELDAQKVFPTLGTTQTLAVKIAARHRMAYHSMFPDHVYSADYFRNLLALGERKRVIVQSSISAAPTAVELLDHFRTASGSIDVPARVLGALAFRHLHPQSQGNLMNRGKELLGLPMSFQAIWQGRDRLYLHSPHTNPVYLAPECCDVAPVRYFSPIDCNLPYILVGGRSYYPTVEDDLSFIEISDDDKPGTMEKLTPEVHAAVCWSHVKFRPIYLPWFARACEVPIGLQPEWLEVGDIAARQAQISRGLEHWKSIVEARIKAHAEQLVRAA